MTGMPACRRRTKFGSHDCDVRNAGMSAPVEIYKTCRQAGMPAPDKIKMKNLFLSGMSACRRRTRIRMAVLFGPEGKGVTSGMLAFRHRAKLGSHDCRPGCWHAGAGGELKGMAVTFGMLV